MRRFRNRIILGHATLLLVTVLLAATAVIGLHVTTSRLERTGRTVTQDVFVVEQLRFRAEHVVASSRGYLLIASTASRARFEEAIQRVEDSLEALRELGAPIEDVEAAVRHYISLARTAVERRAADATADLMPFLETNMDPARERLEQALHAFVERERSMFEEDSAEARGFANHAEQLVLVATVFCLILGAGIAVISMRRLNTMFASEHEATATAQRAVLSRDEVMAIVSHDLRSPLQTIRLARSTLPDTPATARGARAIDGAVARMDALIGRLLDLAALDRGGLEVRCSTCDVRGLIEAAAAGVELRATAADIAMFTTAPEAVVEADRDRILQVLANLLDNALKHTPSGGRIELRATIGEGVRFEVADTGPGIADDQRGHVFQRYFRGSRIAQGSLGLGLYICKNVVTAHGGEIGVDSEPGRGTTFWFTLPISAADVAARRRAS